MLDDALPSECRGVKRRGDQGEEALLSSFSVNFLIIEAGCMRDAVDERGVTCCDSSKGEQNTVNEAGVD